MTRSATTSEPRTFFAPGRVNLIGDLVDGSSAARIVDAFSRSIVCRASDGARELRRADHGV